MFSINTVHKFSCTCNAICLHVACTVTTVHAICEGLIQAMGNYFNCEPTNDLQITPTYCLLLRDFPVFLSMGMKAIWVLYPFCIHTNMVTHTDQEIICFFNICLSNIFEKYKQENCCNFQNVCYGYHCYQNL